ncbi:hypothetical protein D3C87_1401420 [compost metagenome]
MVTRGASQIRSTDISWLNSHSHGSTKPLIGAAEDGSGLQANGMCPSPANSPEVASRPIQPAPGRYTSHQACRSVKSTSVPDGPSRLLTSAVSWIR